MVAIPSARGDPPAAVPAPSSVKRSLVMIVAISFGGTGPQVAQLERAFQLRRGRAFLVIGGRAVARPRRATQVCRTMRAARRDAYERRPSVDEPKHPLPHAGGVASPAAGASARVQAPQTELPLVSVVVVNFNYGPLPRRRYRLRVRPNLPPGGSASSSTTPPATRRLACWRRCGGATRSSW